MRYRKRRGVPKGKGDTGREGWCRKGRWHRRVRQYQYERTVPEVKDGIRSKGVILENSFCRPPPAGRKPAPLGLAGVGTQSAPAIQQPSQVLQFLHLLRLFLVLILWLLLYSIFPREGLEEYRQGLQVRKVPEEQEVGKIHEVQELEFRRFQEVEAKKIQEAMKLEASRVQEHESKRLQDQEDAAMAQDQCPKPEAQVVSAGSGPDAPSKERSKRKTCTTSGPPPPPPKSAPPPLPTQIL